ncbi:MAG: hypothetical protein IPG97_14105 [Microthrixaceae bacterium]|nr:hypothetical protein [Microthrixaceae bacterium]
MKFWTHYWTHETTVFPEEAVRKRKVPLALDHTAGNAFRKRGVRPGDAVYVVSYHRGVIRLLGRMTVERVVDQGEAESVLGYEPWKASDHLLAVAGESTDHYFDVVLTADQVNELRFVGHGGKVVGIKFNRRGDPDQQTLRSVRELTAETASFLDEVLAERARS